MTKDEQRRQARGARRGFVAGLDPAERERLERTLAEHAAPLLAGTVASYASTGAEIDPRFVESLAVIPAKAGTHLPSVDPQEMGSRLRGNDGRVLAFPRVSGDALSFHSAAYADLVASHSGLLEPPADAPLATPAVVLVPLVAADLLGNRIGQGGGHYDRTLAALRAVGPVTAIGLAWEVQIVPAIAADPWDQRLDWIATPERLVDCRTAR